MSTKGLIPLVNLGRHNSLKNATSLLENIGLLSEIAKKAYHPMKSYVREYKSGREIASVALDKSFIS